jgi:hypothetical protein
MSISFDPDMGHGGAPANMTKTVRVTIGQQSALVRRGVPKQAGQGSGTQV